MAIQLQGFGGSLAEIDGTVFRAMRTIGRPIDYGTLGHYKASVITGAIAAGAGADSEIAQFRWTDATRLAVITRVTLDGMIATTAFAAGQIRVYATVARSFSAAGTGGGTVTLSGNNQKLRASMGTSLFNSSGEIRVATTAALGAGTKTFDGAPVGQINSHSAQFGIAAPVIGWVGPACGPNVDLVNVDIASGEMPIVLAQNEGLIVRATVPGTGVWTQGITFRWAEVAAY